MRSRVQGWPRPWWQQGLRVDVAVRRGEAGIHGSATDKESAVLEWRPRQETAKEFLKAIVSISGEFTISDLDALEFSPGMKECNKPKNKKGRMNNPRNELKPSKSKSVIATSGALLALFGLAGCGTISGLKSPDGKSPVNLSAYNQVLVHDFVDKATEKETKNPQEKAQDLKRVTHEFPDLIASETRKTGAFQQVTREGAADATSLVIDGEITRYERGSAAARLWVGMGAGSSYLDALIQFREGGTGNLLATMDVNKNSWGGGGALAAGQTADSFMEEAAKKVAEELQKAKKGH